MRRSFGTSSVTSRGSDQLALLPKSARSIPEYARHNMGTDSFFLGAKRSFTPFEKRSLSPVPEVSRPMTTTLSSAWGEAAARASASATQRGWKAESAKTPTRSFGFTASTRAPLRA